MAGGIGSVIFGYILWRWTGNLWIAAIVSVILWPLLNPIIVAIFQLPAQLIRAFLSLFEPDTGVSVLNEIDETSCKTKEKGMRILLVAKGKTQFFENNTQRELYENMTTEAIQALYEKNEIFRFKFDYILERNLPIRVCATWYKIVLEKCLSKWRKALKDEAFIIGDDDKDVFTIEKQTQENSRKLVLSVLILFDKALPNPKKRDNESNAVENASGQAKTEGQGNPVLFSTDYQMKFDKSIARV